MLRISKMADYGVVIMSLLAREQRLLSATQIVTLAHLSLATVSKLLKRLVHHGLLISQRGTAGGYSLAKPIEQINLVDVIEAIDGPIALTECASQRKHCSQATTCHIKDHWLRVNTLVHQALKEVSLVAMTHSLYAVEPQSITITTRHHKGAHS